MRDDEIDGGRQSPSEFRWSYSQMNSEDSSVYIPLEIPSEIIEVYACDEKSEGFCSCSYVRRDRRDIPLSFFMDFSPTREEI